MSVATLTPDPLAAQAQHALDWVDRFDGADAYTKRRPKPPATWQQLQADVEAIPNHLGAASHVAVTGTLRQATAFTIGAALRMVTHTDVAVVQRGALWISDASYSAPIPPTVAEHHVGQGDDLAVAVEVATPITDDVLGFLRERHVPVERLVVAGPPTGPQTMPSVAVKTPALWLSVSETPCVASPAGTPASTCSSPARWGSHSFSDTGGIVSHPRWSTRTSRPLGTRLHSR